MNKSQIKHFIKQIKSFFNGENLSIVYISLFIGVLAIFVALCLHWLFGKNDSIGSLLTIAIPIMSLIFYHLGKKQGRIEQERIDEAKREFFNERG